MQDDDIFYLTAWQTSALLAKKEISVAELTQLQLTRAAEVQKKLNCFTEIFADQAMAIANKLDKDLDKNLNNGKIDGDKKLYGLPMVFKENAKYIGSHNTSACLVFKDNIDNENDVYVDRLLRHGGIPIAKTTMPEFGTLGTTHSRLYGVTRNPWNLEMTPGGSSGGTSASLAAGVGVIGTGSDIGGSIRIPAAATGTVGYKPPYGRIPKLSPLNYDSYYQMGPMARSVADSIAMMQVMAGEHYQDQTVRPSPIDYQPLLDDFMKKKISLKGMKIAYSVDLGCFEIDDDVRDNMMTLLAQLKDLGASVTESPLKFAKEHLYYAEGRVYLFSLKTLMTLFNDAEHRSLLTDGSLGLLEFANRFKPEDIGRANELTLEMAKDFGNAMQDYDVFICPTNCIPADKAEGYPTPVKEMIDGKEQTSLNFDWYMTMCFNMLGACPALSVPSGWAKNGVPTGVQLVGKFFDELPPLKVGLMLEQEQGWFDKKNRPLF